MRFALSVRPGGVRNDDHRFNLLQIISMAVSQQMHLVFSSKDPIDGCHYLQEGHGDEGISHGIVVWSMPSNGRPEENLSVIDSLSSDAEDSR
jgi:hypothetical protein